MLKTKMHQVDADDGTDGYDGVYECGDDEEHRLPQQQRSKVMWT